MARVVAESRPPDKSTTALVIRHFSKFSFGIWRQHGINYKIRRYIVLRKPFLPSAANEPARSHYTPRSPVIVPVLRPTTACVIVSVPAPADYPVAPMQRVLRDQAFYKLAKAKSGKKDSIDAHALLQPPTDNLFHRTVQTLTHRDV